MTGPVASYLDGDVSGRLHLQHGPIDLVIGVDGAISLEHEAYYRHHAYALAHRRFKTILEELVAELPLLKSRATFDCPEPMGSTASVIHPHDGLSPSLVNGASHPKLGLECCPAVSVRTVTLGGAQLSKFG